MSKENILISYEDINRKKDELWQLIEKGEIKLGQSLHCYGRDGKYLYNFIITKITDKKRHRNMPSAKAGDSVRIHVRSNRTFSQNRMINKGSFVVR